MPTKNQDNSPNPIKVALRSFFDFNITPEERKKTINRLIEESKADNAFYIMLFLSTLITASGLLTDNIVVVLGGMLVAPLLTPILSLGMAMATTQEDSLRRSFNIIAKSVLLVLAVSFVTTLFFNFPETILQKSSEIASRTTTDMISLFIALIAGLAAAFAWARPKMSAALPGVAVAASVLPPLVVSGIGLAYFQKDIFWGAFQLFFSNIIITILASLTIFSLFGFFTVRKVEEKKIKEELKELEREKKEIIKEIAKEEKMETNNTKKTKRKTKK